MFNFQLRWNHEVCVIVYEIVLSLILLTFVTISYWIDAWPDFCTELVSYKSYIYKKIHITTLSEAHLYKLKLLGITKGFFLHVIKKRKITPEKLLCWVGGVGGWMEILILIKRKPSCRIWLGLQFRVCQYFNSWFLVYHVIRNVRISLF